MLTTYRNFNIRFAESADQAGIVALARKSQLLQDSEVPRFESALTRTLFTMIATDSLSKIVGGVMVFERSNRGIWVTNLMIDPAAKGGLGLLQNLYGISLNWASSSGYLWAFTMPSDAGMAGIYRKWKLVHHSFGEYLGTSLLSHQENLPSPWTKVKDQGHRLVFSSAKEVAEYRKGSGEFNRHARDDLRFIDRKQLPEDGYFYRQVPGLHLWRKVFFSPISGHIWDEGQNSVLGTPTQSQLSYVSMPIPFRDYQRPSSYEFSNSRCLEINFTDGIQLRVLDRGVNTLIVIEGIKGDYHLRTVLRFEVVAKESLYSLLGEYAIDRVHIDNFEHNFIETDLGEARMSLVLPW